LKKKVIIIAEAGVNHNGSIDLAYNLIDAASNSGADYVKFQTFVPELLVSKDAKKAEYQDKYTSENNQQEMLKKLALTYSQFGELAGYCKKIGIGFLSTGFDDQSIHYIDSLGIDYHKIPSGEITNLPYLRLIGSLGKKVLLSTGMATLEEVRIALNVLYNQHLKPEDITVLQCTTEYPAPYGEVNLLTIQSMRNDLGVETGFSDHTQGIEVPIAAVALGATVIEKHFTLSRELPGPDHNASLEPAELALMVSSIRKIEAAMGTGIKSPTPSEEKNIIAARRSIHLAKDLSAGHTIIAEDLIMKRPGNGISPMLIDQVIGKKLKADIRNDELLRLDDFQ
jgi:N,N'-diacetyllegionaminate synthase